MDKCKVIFISGISGAGKSTIAQKIVEIFNAKKQMATYIDQDWYTNKVKPMIKLSNGHVLKNWDHTDSLDYITLSKKIIEAKILGNHVIIAGFALRDDMFSFSNLKPDLHFHIMIPKQLSLETRLKLKPGTREDKTLMFEESVWPFYQDTLKKSNINYIIDGVIDDNMKRKPLKDMVKEIMTKINTDLNICL